jgi:hypothetical protein
MNIGFKEWLQLFEVGMGGGGVGSGMEPPLENPKIGAFALNDLHDPNSDQLPPNNKPRKKKRNSVKFTN